MRSFLAMLVAITIAGLSGWAHGLLTDRWGTPANVVAATEQVEHLNLEVDGWTGEETEKLNEHTRKVAGAEGYFSRRYRHDETGATVHVTILCGRPGPISIHTPLYCFELSGMTQLTDETQTDLNGDEGATNQIPAVFWSADFRPPPSKGGPEIRTFWSWSPDGQAWSTPDDPRIFFASHPYLYRLYFTVPRDQVNADAENGDAKIPANDFMPEFLTRFANATQAAPSE